MPGLVLVLAIVLSLVFVIPTNAHGAEKRTSSRYDQITWMDVNAKREARERHRESQFIVYYEIQDNTQEKKKFTFSK